MKCFIKREKKNSVVTYVPLVWPCTDGSPLFEYLKDRYNQGNDNLCCVAQNETQYLKCEFDGISKFDYVSMVKIEWQSEIRNNSLNKRLSEFEVMCGLKKKILLQNWLNSIVKIRFLVSVQWGLLMINKFHRQNKLKNFDTNQFPLFEKKLDRLELLTKNILRV